MTDVEYQRTTQNARREIHTPKEKHHNIPNPPTPPQLPPTTDFSYLHNVIVDAVAFKPSSMGSMNSKTTQNHQCVPSPTSPYSAASGAGPPGTLDVASTISTSLITVSAGFFTTTSEADATPSTATTSVSSSGASPLTISTSLLLSSTPASPSRTVGSTSMPSSIALMSFWTTTRMGGMKTRQE
ncbi:hypothetical protein CYLTODRAFT_97314 [Cylindrobasidium torrendii FP15055 ss-10]|uniref:Uncharacterized protein n=1 Tax=Cylindrobasidium torrendii FP15055 ss-10 TaxID=1314674 RepID=A0A0D7BNN1_9AGAR|nr:hypothetical protein CYLTODRAFT_97314 [Cylindrobasidium torrendii FP15055 ss-10]